MDTRGHGEDRRDGHDRAPGAGARRGFWRRRRRAEPSAPDDTRALEFVDEPLGFLEDEPVAAPDTTDGAAHEPAHEPAQERPHASDAAASHATGAPSSAAGQAPVAGPTTRPRSRSIERVPTASVAPDQPGARWWQYRPVDRGVRSPNGRRGAAPRHGPDATSGNGSEHRAPALGANAAPAPDVAPPGRTVPAAASAAHGSVPSGIAAPTTSGAMAPLTMAAVLAVVGQASARLDHPGAGRVTVPLIGILLAVGIGRWLGMRHPDEPWLPRFLVLGALAKLAASGARYWVLVAGYEGLGDAADYDKYGRGFVRSWFGSADAPVLDNLRKTNFVRWFTGLVYSVFGSDMLVGFFVFALLGLVGSYLWYRATAEAVPFANRRLYLALVLFVPSVAFWPASIGKESLMQLGIGCMALAVALGLKGRLRGALVAAVPGVWLLVTVRAHLLAMVAVAAAAAFILGRRLRRREGGSSFGRALGTVGIVILAAFAVNAAAKALGMEELSIDAIEAELNETTQQTSQGGSEFDTGGDASLTPLDVPLGAVTVLMRPFPWEVETGFQILASIESAALMCFIVIRFRSVLTSLRKMVAAPFLLFCWAFIAVFVTAFSSFANFGLLVRQRSLVLPALFVLLAVDVRAALRHDDGAAPSPDDGRGVVAHAPGRLRVSR